MKDMQTVADYNRKRQLDIFRGQCFNNACVLYFTLSVDKDKNIIEVFDLAEQLYEEGLKRNWLMLEDDKRHIDKQTGLVKKGDENEVGDDSAR